MKGTRNIKNMTGTRNINKNMRGTRNIEKQLLRSRLNIEKTILRHITHRK